MEFDLLGSLDPQGPPHSADAAASPDAGTAPPAVCSRRGCRAPARWSLAWNNPRIHTPARRKTWLACDEHREHLADFLGQRGFLKSVDRFRDMPARKDTSGGATPVPDAVAHAATLGTPDDTSRGSCDAAPHGTGDAPGASGAAGGVGPAGTERWPR
ncbi:hypothetical protein [Kocuria tytonis]|uniref:hypothetical protein n=1 Tax=Kocuria tytonis TaxID=2054280 RepID=UPI00267D5649|nr:hypothetical protein [Kocuria tytonis]